MAAGAPTDAALVTTETASAGTGYDYVHSLVDDHSRLAYSEILPDEKGPTCAAFLERAIRYFADHGIARVDRLMTDNPWAIPLVPTARGMRCSRHPPEVHPPALPWQNGKVERLNRTLATEWAYQRGVFASNTRTSRGPGSCNQYYNTPTSPPRPRRSAPDQPAVTNVLAGYT